MQPNTDPPEPLDYETPRKPGERIRQPRNMGKLGCALIIILLAVCWLAIIGLWLL